MCIDEMKMKRILLQNIGPIRNHKGVWVGMHKVTALCGPQGAGKSTIAKMLSTMCWLEKALTRGDFLPKELMTYDRFRKKYCSFHNIQNYFTEKALLHLRYISSEAVLL